MFPVLLYACVFISGGSALAYELYWTRLLELSIGHTVYAFTTAVAAFMGGSALGSRFMGPWADRSGRPVRFYALLELGIGAYGLLAPHLLELIRVPLLAWHAPLGVHPLLHTLSQFGLSSLVLVVPTALMGATLPVVGRALLRDNREVGGTVATLYSVNTLGAALSCLAFGFWVMPVLGAHNGNLLAVAGNLAVGGVALGLSRGRRKVTFERHELDRGATPAPVSVRTLKWSVVLASAVSMLYQVSWARTLVLVVGSSTYAITTILATFLLGIALGSYAFRRFQMPPRATLFALLQVGVALSAALLIPTFEILPRLFLHLFHGLEGSSYGGVLATQFLVVACVVLPPTTLMGMTFPCAAALLARDSRSYGSDLGRLYAWSTAGAIAGVTLVGFWLIPHIGARFTIALGVVCNGLAGGAILWLYRPRWRRALVAGGAALFCLLAVLPPWDPRVLSLGVAVYPQYFRDGDEEGSFERMFGDIADVPFFREGLGATVSVVKHRSGQTSLFINGKMDAGDNTDVATQTRLATVPLLLHPRPVKVAVVGLGGGMTAGVASRFGDTQRVDVVELEPAVASAAEYFRHINFDVLRSPKVRVAVDDARSFLLAADDPYDVIISEPSNPWMAGIADLFTVEFYRIARQRLEPGQGLFCQWLPAYGTAPEEWRLILRSFLTVFPETSLWISARFDYLLIGRVGTAPVDLDKLQQRLQTSYPMQELQPYIGSDPLGDLLSSFVLNPVQLGTYAGEGPLNTDDRPILQYLAPKSLHKGANFDIEQDIGRLRADFFPSFVTDEGIDREATRMRIVGDLLAAERFVEVEHLLNRLTSMVPPPPAVAPLQMQPGQAVVESFDHAPGMQFFPMVGAFRPEADDPEGLESWDLYAKVHSRQAGVEAGVGRSNTRGLVVRPLLDVVSAGFIAELPVSPSAEYQVDVWLRTELDGQAEGRVGFIEYSSREVRGQPSLSIARRHTVRALRDAVRQAGDTDWKHHSFRFTVSPYTSALQIGFYLDGGKGYDKVFFDDIEVRRLR